MKIIITGSTGMVGEGVLHESLKNEKVNSVLVINRRPCGISHPKLKEIIHANFYDLSTIEEDLKGFDACLFCLGISSIGINKQEYHKITYTLTMHFGKTLSKLNPQMVFSYISGAGTDSNESSRQHWARVKGKTENDLLKLPFKGVYVFRPAFILPIKGLKRTHAFYKYIQWMYPLFRSLYPKGFCTMQELAAAMLIVSEKGYKKHVIEGLDIIQIASKMKEA